MGEARRWLRKILDGHPRRDDAVWLLSEAATNSVTHTDSTVVEVTVAITENDDVRIEVADEGAQTTPGIRPHPDGDLAASGRGVQLIRALASQWGFTEDRPRCVVWFVLSRHALGKTRESHGDESRVDQFALAQGAESRGRRLARHMQGRGSAEETEGMSTDDLMELLRSE
ncbi:hypothetical protein Sme01_60330 [Sphaerisporangium melleum]|uniref:Histidine kinase/HSP90-like ATPase domain-containing protein n=1 Tax=Sphaerisporangium melleum TaxID=321316 RepID=A0A917RBP7_9ACTN|nr:hypothetical protein GCM10007964_46520 [Sphaerisporangium melleum]GII73557.1 hypothetical protein Sme01_60330 [Sphaerisporangium melleum]